MLGPVTKATDVPQANKVTTDTTAKPIKKHVAVVEIRKRLEHTQNSVDDKSISNGCYYIRVSTDALLK